MFLIYNELSCIISAFDVEICKTYNEDRRAYKILGGKCGP
jgi:hypothetical protein